MRKDTIKLEGNIHLYPVSCNRNCSKQNVEDFLRIHLSYYYEPGATFEFIGVAPDEFDPITHCHNWFKILGISKPVKKMEIGDSLEGN